MSDHGREDFTGASADRRSLLKGLAVALLFVVGQRTRLALAATGDKDPTVDVWQAAIQGFIPLVPGLQPEALSDIADSILDDLAHHDPETLKSVTGIFSAVLEDHETGKHRGADILLRLQRTNAFASFWPIAIRHIFRNPLVWALLGYQGSSVEYGGYLGRGFDDISWLK